MTERSDADILEVIAGQPRQQRSVDIVLLERLPVLFEPKASEPTRDIHRLPRFGAREDTTPKCPPPRPHTAGPLQPSPRSFRIVARAAEKCIGTLGEGPLAFRPRP